MQTTKHRKLVLPPMDEYKISLMASAIVAQQTPKTQSREDITLVKNTLAATHALVKQQSQATQETLSEEF